MTYFVTLGTPGPTDCCLVLNSYSNMEDERTTSIEFGVESLGWRILSQFWDISTQSSEEIPEWLGDILMDGE